MDHIDTWIQHLPHFPHVYELYDPMNQTPLRQRKAPQHTDELTTPRPSTLPLSLSTAPTLSSPSVSSASSAISEAASSASRGAKRRRSESPKKRSAQLNFARYPITQCSIGVVRDLPRGVQSLVKSLRECQMKSGILHEESRDSMRAYLDGDDGDAMMERLFSKQRGRLGGPPDIRNINEIVQLANAHEVEGASEAAWNGDIHTALLRAALRTSAHKDSLRCDNVTTASLDADAFSSSTYRRDPNEAGSRIDFSIGLRIPTSEQRRLSTRAVALNPTLYEPIRFSPTAIHIETKLPGEGWYAAKSQLCTWVTQHVSKLRELLALADQTGDLPLPVLPLLVSQGHTWTCLLFEDHGDGARLHASIPLSFSQIELDAQAGIAALHVLMDWAQTEYRPWFEANILRPLLTL